MVTKIYLIRHGETVDPQPKRYKGHTDVPLSVRGVTQIKELADYLASRNGFGPYQNTSSCRLDAVFCSGLQRARKSAEIIARPFGLKPVVIDELKERSFGEWEGMTFDEIQELWPDAFSNWAADPLRHSPPGGESTIEVRDRLIKGISNIIGSAEEWNRESEEGQDGDSKIIAVVAHGGVNRILLCEWLGMPLENIFRIEQDFGCLNIIELHDGFPVVKHLNMSVNHV